MHPRAQELIETLQLTPHPEGGFFREVFRSAKTVTPSDGRPIRSALTTIYFLLPAGAYSRWHQVLSDEVWHFYEGAPLELLCDDERWILGPVGERQSPTHTVPAGAWQAARSLGEYTLVGCTVGPGFEFADFSLRDGNPLAEK
ncbi:MAG: cupin domain-containing protein [Armatimonadetes bacterium]|jgi:predicted cupin superfamily sugar epimerase|nr:cupin domain-containing protein [Armatimonadota bacterium]